jgi:hypothetical protein
VITRPAPIVIRVIIETRRIKPDHSQVGEVATSDLEMEWSHPWEPLHGDLLRVEVGGVQRKWRVTGREFAAGTAVIRVTEAVYVTDGAA